MIGLFLFCFIFVFCGGKRERGEQTPSIPPVARDLSHQKKKRVKDKVKSIWAVASQNREDISLFALVFAPNKRHHPGTLRFVFSSCFSGLYIELYTLKPFRIGITELRIFTAPKIL